MLHSDSLKWIRTVGKESIKSEKRSHQLWIKNKQTKALTKTYLWLQAIQFTYKQAIQAVFLSLSAPLCFLHSPGGQECGTIHCWGYEVIQTNLCAPEWRHSQPLGVFNFQRRLAKGRFTSMSDGKNRSPTKLKGF